MMADNNNPMWVCVQHRASSRFPAFLAGKPSTSNNCTITNASGRIIGKVQGREFVKRVQASRHFLRKPPAIAFDVSSLRQAEQAGARIVKVIDTESDSVYQTQISNIWSKGFSLDRGHGHQIALPLREWSIGDAPLAEQLTLWG